MAFEISPQPMYIYDVDKGVDLPFDGVIKVEHTISLKIEDDPSNIKDGSAYVNNAKNESNEVVVDVVMSEVYTTVNALSGSTGSRSRNAYEVLMDIKKSRRKVQVITSIMTYNNMLIKAVQLLQDESSPFGWQASITFREATDDSGTKKNDTQASKPVDDGTKNGRTPSIWVRWVGSNAI